MTHVTRQVLDCGTLVDGYGRPMAAAARSMLADIPARLCGTPALIVPTARTPFPRLLSRRTSHRPIWLADPSQEDLDWQRQDVDDRAAFIAGGVDQLPACIQDVAFVLNPFGLQHTLAEAPQYASAVRRHTRNDALLLTLDWGPTRYPQDLASLSGIAEEIQFSIQSQLAPYSVETGWRLIKEMDFLFEVRHTVEGIAALLNDDNAARLRDAVLRDRVISVGSSVLYRLYEAV